MKIEPTDWRLQDQMDYLKNQIFHYKKYSDRITKTDHDHCEFCGSKFSDKSHDDLREGYCTLDDYRWLCETCFFDFKEMFQFTCE